MEPREGEFSSLDATLVAGVFLPCCMVAANASLI